MATYSEAHICQCLSRLATVSRDSIVTIYGERRKPGMQFVEGVMGLAHGLIQLGINPGDVVSISALNSDLYLEWMLAITYVGGIAAPLNYRWSVEEAKSAMEVARPVLLVKDTSRGCSLFALACLNGYFLLLNCLSSLLEDLQHSTTFGHLKELQLYASPQVYLHTAPMCHIGGISSALAMLMAGGCHVILPKFEASLAIKSIREHKVTSLITVPTMMADLISFNRMNQTSATFESVKKILNGGGGLSVDLIKQATKMFPRAILLSAYGMTEACSSLTFMTLYDPKKESHHLQPHDDHPKSNRINHKGGICVGKPAPHVELKVASAEESCNAGRVMMRGPHVMLRYWGQSPSKHLNPVCEGWIDTGDIGEVDDHGNLWLIGRAKDRIKSGGENIYPDEVEAVLSQHPGISRIVVIGIPDSRLTEMVIACVRLEDGWQWADFVGVNHSAGEQSQCVSSEILRDFCRQKNLTGFKIPRRFVLWKNDFPLTTTGKLRRDQVRAEFVSYTEFLSSKL